MNEFISGRLIDGSRNLLIDDTSRLVILSDLHMGDGGRTDDFAKNALLVRDALEKYYLPRGFTLILNGDIEELLRNRLSGIQNAWPDIYSLFGQFRSAGRLVRLVGNHEIVSNPDGDADRFDGEALKLTYGGNTLLVFHGHQAGTINSGKYNRIIGFVLRFFANRLGIGNRSIAHDSRKKYQLERQVYDFSRREGIVSIIGHTHRPLFESLSKRESIGYRIERLCRKYSGSDAIVREQIRATIRTLKEEYRRSDKKNETRLVDSLYGEMLVPCLFNAGCGIGKKGVTALEIKKGKISLVYWSEINRTKKYLQYNEYRSARRVGVDSFRLILRRQPLSYIFSRISLVGDES